MSKIDKKYIKIKYTILPSCIRQLIEKKDYSYAYKSENSYVIGLRIKNQTNYNCLELEYSIKKNRFLIREEREAKVPKDRKLFFSEYGVEIFIQYSLEEKTDILKESYQIYSFDTNEKLDDSEQDFFSMKCSFKDKAKEVYVIEEEKNIYKGFTDYEKATYWAGKFHRWMRQVGESDMDEIEFFEKESFESIRNEEPNIDTLMPMILTQLAKAWMFDIDDFFKGVNKRLETEYKLPTKEL